MAPEPAATKDTRKTNYFTICRMTRIIQLTIIEGRRHCFDLFHRTFVGLHVRFKLAL
jgi:hypothetical protein